MNAVMAIAEIQILPSEDSVHLAVKPVGIGAGIGKERATRL
jgi:hypothetical protein